MIVGKFGPLFKSWWAWYPVTLENGNIVCGQTVARRYFERGMFYDLDWEYRELSDEWVAKVGLEN